MKKLNFTAIILGISSVLSLVLLAQGVSAAPGTVTLTSTPTTQTVTVGQTAIYTININRDNFADKVTLSATGLPAGASAAFSPNTTTAASSTLKVKTITSTPIGSFSITIKGTATGITIAPITIKLITKAVGSVTISVLPAVQTIIAGQSAFYDISIARTNYDGPVTLSSPNLPAGISTYFDPAMTNGNSSRMYLYSNGLPFAESSLSMSVVAAPPPGLGISSDAKPISVIVNCGIAWASQFNAHLENTPENDFATAVEFDSAGNVYVAGHREVGVEEVQSWLAKYNSNGVQQWIRPIITSWWFIYDTPVDIEIDGSGNIFVAGERAQTGSLSEMDGRTFVAKFDSNGNLLGSHDLDMSAAGGDSGSRGMKLTFNSAGNPVLTVIMDLDAWGVGMPQQTVWYYMATYDLIQYTFDSSFAESHSTLLHGVPGLPSDVTVDRDGAIYITGTDVRFPGPFRYSSFVWKFVPNGGPGGWFIHDISPADRRFSGDSSSPQKIVVTQNKDVFVIGETLGTPSQYWQTKILANGTQGWLKRDVTVNAKTNTLTVDGGGNLYFGGATDLSLGTLNAEHQEDAWFAKRSGSTGDLLYIKQFNSAGADSLNDLKVNGSTIFLAGQTRNLVHSSADKDSFLMKFSQLNFPLSPPAITSVNPVSVNPGGLFSINGANLGNTHAVFHNDKFLPFLINSSTTLTASAPDGLNGTGTISVICGCYATGFSLD